MRLFIAIDLPQEIKEKIDLILFNLTKEIRSPVKWVEMENLHINIKFLDEVLENKIEEIKNIIKKSLIKNKEFDIRIKNSLVFPNINQPRIIGLRIIFNRELDTLARDLKKKLEDLPFIKKEFKPFKPHLTLGRVRFNLSNKERDIVSEIKFEDRFPIKEICLFESRLTSNGPIYNILEKFNLWKKQKS